MKLIIPLLVAVFNLFLLLFPNETISAAKEGILLWANNVLPSLLPFIIGTNILVSTGFVSFIGGLLEPIMEPLFNVPGVGGFAFITGITSGYPMGAKVTASLKEKELVSSVEAQRLLSFVNNSGPLFVVGAVGAGMFANSAVGYFLLAVHYVAAILNGLLFRFYKRGGQVYKKGKKKYPRAKFSAPEASFGESFAQSVKNSVESILLIGGYITLFCVISKILELSNIFTYLCLLLERLSVFVNEDLFTGLSVGLFEITNGIKKLTLSGSLRAQVILASFVLSFGGLSIHAQALGFLSKSNIQVGVYFLSKFIHGLLSFLLSFLLYPAFESLVGSEKLSGRIGENPALYESLPAFLVQKQGFMNNFLSSTAWFMLTFLGVCLFAIGISFLKRGNAKKPSRRWL